jgi:drug/metabolite transporter superfamily protein YnfA
MIAWLKKQDRNELAYWSGVTLLGVGLAHAESIGVALAAVGGVMILESVLTSYLAAWMGKG